MGKETGLVPFVASKLISTPVEDMETSAVLEAWAVLDRMEGIVKDRKAVLRKRLLEDVEKGGVDTGKTSHVLKFPDGSKASRSVSSEKQLDPQKMTALLVSKGIAPETVIEKKTTVELVVNLSKVHKLVEEGLLEEAEVNDLRKTTVTLRVEPPETLKTMLDLVETALSKKAD